MLTQSLESVEYDTMTYMHAIKVVDVIAQVGQDVKRVSHACRTALKKVLQELLPRSVFAATLQSSQQEAKHAGPYEVPAQVNVECAFCCCRFDKVWAQELLAWDHKDPALCDSTVKKQCIAPSDHLW